jgi:predicted unusual protein kinase regulating ubiquinone biosynthesis (AarF/ABC1/UbiB family)
MPQKKEALKEIRATLLTRGLSLAKASLKASGLAASQWLNPKRSTWLAQIEVLIHQLGELKGTAMKVGQTLSMYGEHLLPKEVNEILKSLQQNSPPLAWSAVEPVLRQELSTRFGELEIEHTPVAAASIGQVHRARRRSDGTVLALKVQYPGVDQAVDTDIKLIKFILSISDLVPRGPRFDQVFAEIREMFLQEVDYTQELKATEAFYQRLTSDPLYHVPRPYPEYSTRRVLATEFIEGQRADSPEVQALSQERRNQIGEAFFKLYLRELLEFQDMQTDPHLGNYMIQTDPDRLILLDFGAVRTVPPDFLNSYIELMQGGLNNDARQMERGGRLLGLLTAEDSLELVDDYVKLCRLLMEPFNQGVYDWGASDLPKRVAAQVSRIAYAYKLRAPPRELVFLDRKLGGVFIFLSVLKCKFDGRPILTAALRARADSSPNRA